jgi:hypothetical protein
VTWHCRSISFVACCIHTVAGTCFTCLHITILAWFGERLGCREEQLTVVLYSPACDIRSNLEHVARVLVVCPALQIYRVYLLNPFVCRWQGRTVPIFARTLYDSARVLCASLLLLHCIPLLSYCVGISVVAAGSWSLCVWPILSLATES